MRTSKLWLKRVLWIASLIAGLMICFTPLKARADIDEAYIQQIVKCGGHYVAVQLHMACDRSNQPEEGVGFVMA